MSNEQVNNDKITLEKLEAGGWWVNHKWDSALNYHYDPDDIPAVFLLRPDPDDDEVWILSINGKHLGYVETMTQIAVLRAVIQW